MGNGAPGRENEKEDKEEKNKAEQGMIKIALGFNRWRSQNHYL